MHKSRAEQGAVRTKLVVWALLVVMAIVGVVVFAQYRARVAKSVETAGNKFTAALVAKDTTNSYNMLTDRAKKEMSQADWQTWLNFTFKDYGAGKPTLVAKTTVNDPYNTYGTNATPTRLKYQFNFKGKDYTSAIILVKSGEVWKVSEVGAFE